MRRILTAALLIFTMSSALAFAPVPAPGLLTDEEFQEAMESARKSSLEYDAAWQAMVKANREERDRNNLIAAGLAAVLAGGVVYFLYRRRRQIVAGSARAAEEVVVSSTVAAIKGKRAVEGKFRDIQGKVKDRLDRQP